MSLNLILIAIALAAASGLPGLGMARSSVWGQRIAAGFMVCAALVGLVGAALGFCDGAGRVANFPWPAMGNAVIGVDPLSAFFLMPIFLLGALGSIYGLGYWPQKRHPGNGRKLRLFWGTLVAGMALLVIGRHAMSFLMGWEIMALSAFLLVSAEDHREEGRQAGWIYLVSAHISTLVLFALFVLWRWATGSYALQPVANDTMSLCVMNGLFALALIGFGLKAGMMPLHFWLPVAHSNAPTHVSAMLSGVVIKMGIYGLVRFLSLFPVPPSAWGGLILALGAVSGLLGVVFAISQHDLKRLLAYHSVENIGIILMGLGLALLGRSAGRPEWVVLGLAGCLLHVWNHGLFKALLFMSAGSVVHHAHTRQIDRLGGLARTMPWTAALFLVGAVAICGLPPLNGFVSEFFVYFGLLRSMTADGASVLPAALGVPVLALIGALALACFVKVYGAVFLGNPRTQAAAHARESPISMRGPMLVLAACCLLIGLAPSLVSHLLDRAIVCWSPGLVSPSMSLRLASPLWAISVMGVALVAGSVALMVVVSSCGRLLRTVGTWDCGYACPTSRMQYTASSFARTIVTMFHWVVRPHVSRPQVNGPFPLPTAMHSHVDDVVLDRFLVPVGSAVERWFGWFHRFQRGLTQHYVLYILITVILMLGALMPIKEVVVRWFQR